MNFTRMATAAIALALVSGAANAASLVNADKSVHHVSFATHHGKTKHFTLAGGHGVNINCAKGGTLTLGKASGQCDAHTKKITIKGGKFEV